jgi:hypothetical protein
MPKYIPETSIKSSIRKGNFYTSLHLCEDFPLKFDESKMEEYGGYPNEDNLEERVICWYVHSFNFMDKDRILVFIPGNKKYTIVDEKMFNMGRI